MTLSRSDLVTAAAIVVIAFAVITVGLAIGFTVGRRLDVRRIRKHSERRKGMVPPPWVETRPIPPEDLKRASEFVHEEGWVK